MTDLFSTVNINSSFQRSTRIDNKISKEFLDNFVFHDTSKKVLNQISSSLINSNQSGFVSGREALKVHQLIDALISSSINGKVVKI